MNASLMKQINGKMISLMKSLSLRLPLTLSLIQRGMVDDNYCCYIIDDEYVLRLHKNHQGDEGNFQPVEINKKKTEKRQKFPQLAKVSAKKMKKTRRYQEESNSANKTDLLK